MNDPVTDLKKALRDIALSGRIDPSLAEIMGRVKDDPEAWMNALNDSELRELLLKLGADTSGGGTTGDIGIYFSPGRTEKYRLHWPLKLPVELPISFDDLDPKTQFFILFNEWSRREMEGMMALSGGQCDDAEAIFNECIERAKQVEVAELEARSYEGLMRIAQKKGENDSAMKWLMAARMVRLKGKE
jgi:hypothetical protein